MEDTNVKLPINNLPTTLFGSQSLATLFQYINKAFPDYAFLLQDLRLLSEFRLQIVFNSDDNEQHPIDEVFKWLSLKPLEQEGIEYEVQHVDTEPNTQITMQFPIKQEEGIEIFRYIFARIVDSSIQHYRLGQYQSLSIKNAPISTSQFSKRDRAKYGNETMEFPRWAYSITIKAPKSLSKKPVVDFSKLLKKFPFVYSTSYTFSNLINNQYRIISIAGSLIPSQASKLFDIFSKLSSNTKQQDDKEVLK